MKTKTPKTVIGIDLGDKKHAVCVLGKGGEILAEFTVPNSRAALSELAGDHPGARVAMEVGGHSPWTSRLLESLGLEVIVANACKLRAIYTNERKCDELDARMLAKLARVDPGLLHPVRHGSEGAQRDLLQVKLRDTLVRQRVNVITSVRHSLKSLGVRLPSPCTSAFAQRARTLLREQHPETLPAIEPCLCVLDELCARIRQLEAAIDEAARVRHPAAAHLQQIPGVGPITSLCFVLSIEDPGRFANPRDVGAYLGLVPGRDQSGDTDRQLPITRAGNRYLRALLVQCAQYILGHHGPDCDLRRGGLKLAARGGRAAKKKAVVAIARKLAVLMLVLWREQSSYEPLRGRAGRAA